MKLHDPTEVILELSETSTVCAKKEKVKK